jgi:hypothetical protein
MKPNELIPVLKTGLTNSFNILVKGKPGTGKSDIILSVCKELDYDVQINHAVVSESIDYKGLPNVLNGEAEFTPYGNLKQMLTAEKPLVVFFDDLGQAPQSVQSAIMQLILAREINGKKISDHVRFVAATNSKKDNAGVSGLITPLLSRFNLITELEVDVEAWVKWALRPDIKMPLELVSFVQFRPNIFLGKTLKVENGVEKWEDTPITKDIENFVCSRTVANLGKWIKAGVIDLDVFTGTVGRGFATEFMAFYKTFTKIAGLPKKIILDPLHSEVPKEQDVIFALTAALSYQANETNFDAIMQYVERIPTEFAVFFLKYTITREPKLKETNAFINWNVKNQGVII